MSSRTGNVEREGGGSSSFLGLSRVFSLRSVRWMALDWHVLLLAGLLLALGMLFIHGMSEADRLNDRSGTGSVQFAKHMSKVLFAAPFFFAALALRPRWIARNAWLVYGVCTFLLVLVPIIGQSRNGAKRWIPMPAGLDLQPSELVKIGVVLALARVLYRNKLERPRDWWPPLLVALVPMALVAKQPDLGTALTLVPITLGMLYLAGARMKVIVRFLVLAGILGFGVFKLQIGMHGYQAQRVSTWTKGFDAEDLIAARNGAAFHSYHARVAIGNGGMLGQGIGQGVANQAAHLPERDCDSVFAVVAEESGLVLTSGILLGYALFIALILGSASSIRDRFSRLAVGGLALYFAAHLFINVGVNLGLMPLTGVPLPLFSTGGSSLAASFTALGLALGLAAHREPSLDHDSFHA